MYAIPEGALLHNVSIITRKSDLSYACRPYDDDQCAQSTKKIRCVPSVRCGLVCAYLKSHLSSVQHLEALEFLKKNDMEQVRKGFPTNFDQKLAIENAMKTGAFMTSNNLSYRFYPQLCSLLSESTPEDQVHPLGNRHQTHASAAKILRANYAANEESLRKQFLEPNLATESAPKIAIMTDKGTAPKDVTRQAVVATSLKCDGMAHETLLGVPPIRHGDAASTAENLKSTVKKKTCGVSQCSIYNNRQCCSVCRKAYGNDLAVAKRS